MARRINYSEQWRLRVGLLNVDGEDTAILDVRELCPLIVWVNLHTIVSKERPVIMVLSPSLHNKPGPEPGDLARDGAREIRKCNGRDNEQGED